MNRENTRSLTKHYVVSGRVQRVWYRNYVKKQAERLHLSGYVKNLEDGRVEVVVRGKIEQLEIFKGFLYKGSLFAKVKKIEEKNIEQELDFKNIFLIK